MRSKKQKQIYLECCESDRETELVESVFENNTISQIANNYKTLLCIHLIEKVAKWRLYVGSSKDVGGELLKVEAMHVLTEYGDLTIGECDIAFNMFLHQELPMNYSSFYNFTPLLISQILTSYKSFKNGIYAKLLEKSAKKFLEPVVVTPEDRVANMKECLQMCFDQITTEVGYTIITTVVWEYLIATKKLNLTSDMIEAAKRHIAEKSKKDTNGCIDGGIVPLKSLFVDAIEKTRGHRDRILARQYCLSRFFETNDISELVNSVSIQELIKQ